MSESAARELAILSELNRMLTEATNVSQVKDLRDKAEAVRKYAKDARLGLELQNQAAEARLRAERRAGEMLSGMKLHDGNPWLHDATRLADLGIEKTQSHRWQRLAAVPLSVFEQFLQSARAARLEITAAGLLRLAAARQFTVVDASRPKPRRGAPSRDSSRRNDKSSNDFAHEGVREALFHCRQLLSMLRPLKEDERTTLSRAERRLAVRLLEDIEVLLSEDLRRT